MKYTLTSTQLDVWVDQRLNETSPQYNIGGYINIKGALNPETFSASVNSLVKNNDALRLSFIEEKGEPRQIIREYTPFILPIIDFSHEKEPEKSAIRWMKEDFKVPFDISRDVYKSCLLKLSEEHYISFNKYHHLAIDGWGISLSVDRIIKGYNGELTKECFSYIDFLKDDEEYRKSDRYLKSRDFWKKTFSSRPDSLFTSNAVNPPAEGALQSLRESLEFTPEEFSVLKNRFETMGVSPFTGFLTTFSLYISRMTGLKELVVGIPLLNRASKSFKKTIGLFAETSPVKMDFTEGCYESLLKTVQKDLGTLYRYQRFPAGEIETLAGTNGKNRLFDIVFSYEHHNYNNRVQDFNTEIVTLSNDHQKTAMTIHLEEYQESENVVMNFDYRPDVFPFEMSRFVQRFKEFCSQNIPEQTPAEQIPLLGKREEEELFTIFNSGLNDVFPYDKTLLSELNSMISSHGSKTALMYNEMSWTYEELNREAEKAASWLIHRGNIEPGDLVGITLERSPELIITILAILKAGAAYLPIDPAYPQERIDFMIEDASPRLVIGRDITFDAMQCEKEYEPRRLNRDSLLYVIYTSGSTGRPKGAAITHGNFLNYIEWASDFYFDGSEGGNFPLFTSVAFDLTATSLFLPLLRGKSLTLYGEEQITETLHSVFTSKTIDAVKLTPAHISLLKGLKISETGIKTLITGGEELLPGHVEILRNISQDIRIFNEYGPTEATVGCIVKEIGDEERILIGRPINNAPVYILSQGQPVPIGIPGEIFIGGHGVSPGYINREELNREKFPDNPWIPGTKMYKTGDLARWTDSGEIDYLGRIDNQVKIRGFRIEPGEIQTALEKLPKVIKAAVNPVYNRHNEKELTAWVVSTTPLNPGYLRASLSETLPGFMIPDHFISVPEIPLTVNGKVDYKSLPHPGDVKSSERKSTRGIHREILNIWKEVLDRDEIDPDQNFFDIGGNSLKMIKIAGLMKEQLGIDIPVVNLYTYPTLKALSSFLEGEYREEISSTASGSSQDIAVIGLSGRFPGAQNIHLFWENLKKGKESVSFFSEEEMEGWDRDFLKDPHLVRAGGLLENKECFDPGFFGYTPKDAEYMDPQMRLFHEESWKALEDAGYNPADVPGSVGIYAGATLNRDWLIQGQNRGELSDYELNQLNNTDFLSTRVAYKLNLKGPSYSVNTACSTSLTTIVMACNDLASGRCDMALAGGVTLTSRKSTAYIYREGMIMSEDGHCRPFDSEGTGVVGGEGIGVVVLKPLNRAIEDGDPVYSVIKGYGTNNDGSDKAGYTAPGVKGQTALIKRVMKEAGVTGRDITYVEAHGTGTKMGDPIEVQALKNAFNSDKKGFCALGSVKGNIGHLDCAAGVAGFIKTVLSVKHRTLVPTINLREVNPLLDLENTPFYINRECTPWKGAVRAGISSLGMGGSNAHVIMEAAPEVVKKSNISENLPPVITLSSHNRESLEEMKHNVQAALEVTELCLTDLAHTLSEARAPQKYRFSAAAFSRESLVKQLQSQKASEEALKEPEVVWLFPGQGSQYAHMARDLEENHPVFREAKEKCFEILLKERGTDLSKECCDSLALFITEYALAQVLLSVTGKPHRVLGHSLGEYTAACIAGVMSLKETLCLIYDRDLLVQKTPSGGMLSILCEDITPYLSEDLDTAVINSPGVTVLSGSTAAVETCEVKLNRDNVSYRRLRSEKGFHSSLLDPVLGDFRKLIEEKELKSPEISIISSHTGQLLRDEALSPDYWVNHFRKSVRFDKAVKSLPENSIMLEVGPGDSLKKLLSPSLKATQRVLNLLPPYKEKGKEREYLAARLGEAWESGLAINQDLPGARRINLPGTVFKKEKYDKLFGIPQNRKTVSTELTYLLQWQHSPQSQQPLPSDENILILQGELNLAEPLKNRGCQIFTSLDEIPTNTPLHRVYYNQSHRGIYPLTELLHALGNRNEEISFTLLTKDAHWVSGSEEISPLMASLAPLIRSAQQEYPGLSCINIDYSACDLNKIELPLRILRERKAGEKRIAFRGRKRFNDHFEPVSVRENNSLLREKGVYLLTGGLGGMGLTFALWLAANYQARLILSTRSEFPSRDTWHDSCDEKIRTLLQIEKSGGEISVIQGTLENKEAVEKLLSKAEIPFGALHGIFHTAGLSDFTLLSDIKAGEAEKVLSPKITGTEELYKQTKEKNMDFMILCSSMSSVMAGTGMAVYSAANAWMDALATTAETYPVISVNWPGWTDVGMSAGLENNYSITPEEGVEILDKALKLQSPGLFISPEEINSYREETARAVTERVHNLQTRPELSGEYTAPVTDEEKLLVSLWEETLGISGIGITDDFFELGGHSLGAITLISSMEKKTGIKITLAELSQAPTIRGILPLFKEDKQEETELPVLIHDEENRSEPFPLTDVQQAYWIGRSDSYDLGGVGTHGYLEIYYKDLNPEGAEAALNRLIQRHEMMRMVVTDEGKQKILKDVPEYRVPFTDYLHASEEEEREGFLAVRKELSHQFFSGTTWPLFDFRITRFRDGTYKFHCSMDCLIMDATSSFIFLKEFQEECFTPKEREPLKVSFRDYVLTEEKLKESPLWTEAQNYWKERVQTMATAPQLPLAKKPSEIKETRFTKQRTVIEGSLWGKIKQKAAKAGVTPTLLLTHCFGEVMKAWSKRDHFTLNLTLFNRIPFAEGVEDIVGDFTSLTLLEMDFREKTTFTRRVKTLQKRLWQDLEYKQFSGVEVQREMSRVQGETITIPVVITSTLGVGGASYKQSILHSEAGEHEFHKPWSISQTPQVWIDCQICENGDDLQIDWDSVEELFPPHMLEEMFAAYKELVLLCAGEEVWESDKISLLPPSQRKIFEEANRTEGDIPRELMFEAFRKMAAHRGDNPAVINGETVLSYRELHNLAGNLSETLKRKGAKTNTLIAVLMHKGWEQIPAVLGIQYAGAAYMPVDASFPKERIEQLLTLGEADIVVSTKTVLKELNLSANCVAIEDISREDVPCDLPLIQTPEDLAYVIFTSGSTGEPKGVMINHLGAVNTIKDINEQFNVGINDRSFALSSLSFDLSVYDIFGLLSAGGAVVIPSKEESRDPGRWIEILKKERVTLWNSVPALMQMLTDYTKDQLKDLRAVLLSGDWIPLNLPGKIREISSAEVRSLGGATEASIWSIHFPVKEVLSGWKSIPYGKPLKNQTFHIFRAGAAPDNLMECPLWVPGDLYIGGTGVAMGYWRDKEKTEASFITHPETGETLYRTGDLGRYMDDGNIEFLGREDSQVKVQGYRIELGEIESLLNTHEMVENSVVDVRKAKDNSKRLAAWIQVKRHSGEGVGDLAQAGNSIVDKGERTLFKLEQHGIREIQGETITLGTPLWDQPLAEKTEGVISDRVPEITDLAKLLSPLASVTQESTPLPKYLYPSAGSLYPVQAYLIIEEGAMKDLKGGVYYYHPSEHGLKKISNETPSEQKGLSLVLAGDLAAMEPLYGKFSRDFTLQEGGYMAALIERVPEFQAEQVKYSENSLRDLCLLSENHKILSLFSLALTEKKSVKNTISRWQRKSYRSFSPELTSTETLSEMLRTLPPLKEVDIWIILKGTKETQGGVWQWIENSLLKINNEEQFAGIFRGSETIYSEASFAILLGSQEKSDTGEFLSGYTGQLLMNTVADSGLGLCAIGIVDQGEARLKLSLEPGYNILHSFLGGVVTKEMTEAAPSEEKRDPADFLRKYLSALLPEYMVPAHFMAIDEIPLTANGKVNRKALPDPEEKECNQGEMEEASGALEESLLSIWKRVLLSEDAGVTQNFFDLGGNSMGAVQVCSLVQKEHGVKLSLVDFMRYGDIRQLARFLEKELAEKEFLPLVPCDERETYPVSSPQKRQFLLNLMEEDTSSYNINSAFMLEGSINKKSLEGVFKELIRHHESLRTRFFARGHEVYQVVEESCDIQISWLEASEENLEEVIDNFKGKFSYEELPLFKIAIIRLKEEKHLLLLDMAHIIADASSMGVLSRDFASLCNGEEISARPFRYRDFATWQKRSLEGGYFDKQREFWKETLKGVTPISVYTDFPRKEEIDYRGADCSLKADAGLVNKLNTLRGENTLFSLVLAAINIVLSRWWSQDDILLGAPTFGRNQEGLKDIVGVFLGTIVYRNCVEGEMTFHDFVTEVNKGALAALDNQDIPYEAVLETVSPEREKGRNALFDAALDYVTSAMIGESPEIRDMKMTHYPLKKKTASFDLLFYVTEHPDSLDMSLNYRTSLYKRETAEFVLSQVLTVLEIAAENPLIQLKEIPLFQKKKKTRKKASGLKAIRKK